MIRLWTLGDIENHIYPTKLSVDKLAELLKTDADGKIVDIIWGPELKVQILASGPIDRDLLNEDD